MREIAEISGVSKNYLADGLQSDDLTSAPIIDVKIEQIISTSDVSSEMRAGVASLPANQRAQKIAANKKRLESSCQSTGNLSCQVQPVAHGLEYQLTLSREFSQAALRFIPSLENLFSDHNPNFLQGGIPEKPAFAILQLIDKDSSDKKVVAQRVNSYVKLNEVKISAGDPVYTLGYSNIYKRWIPKYWVNVNLNSNNDRLDDFLRLRYN